MPAKNIIKPYHAGGYYHLYNRGVNKRNIFRDKQDYATLLSYLKTYLLPVNVEKLAKIILDPSSSETEKQRAKRALNLNNFHGKIDLLAYCLMPNHYHFLIKQTDENDMADFTRSLMTRYTMYFNKRYHRVGSLFQGNYKAVMIVSDEQLWHLSRYIHRNSLDLSTKGEEQNLKAALRSQPSSYPNYLGEVSQAWLKPKNVLSSFSKSGFNSYRSFVEYEDSQFDEEDLDNLRHLILDS